MCPANVIFSWRRGCWVVVNSVNWLDDHFFPTRSPLVMSLLGRKKCRIAICCFSLPLLHPLKKNAQKTASRLSKSLNASSVGQFSPELCVNGAWINFIDAQRQMRRRLFEKFLFFVVQLLTAGTTKGLSVTVHSQQWKKMMSLFWVLPSDWWPTTSTTLNLLQSFWHVGHCKWEV